MLLKLELTESTVLENIDDAIAKMRALKDFWCQVRVDDSGTGYSSLSYLKLLPLDQIKNRPIICARHCQDNGDAVMVMAIVDLGMNFELEVIAEGVETRFNINSCNVTAAAASKATCSASQCRWSSLRCCLNRNNAAGNVLCVEISSAPMPCVQHTGNTNRLQGWHTLQPHLVCGEKDYTQHAENHNDCDESQDATP